MLSSRELWNVIVGRSSLVEPESVGEELERCKSLLKDGIDYYKKPNAASESKIKSTATVKRKEFILKLSKVLDLDEWQTHELFQNYLRIGFRGSGPQLQAILKHEVQSEGFILRVLDFYLKERLYLFKCISYLISYWQDDISLYSKQFGKIVNEYAVDNFINKLIKTLDANFKQLPNHEGIKGNIQAQTEFTTQYIREQNEIVEIIFLYYKDFEMPVEIFHTLANLFRCRHFGKSQVTRKYMNKHAQELTDRFGYISSLILLQGLDLELLRKSLSNDEGADLKDHCLLANGRWKAIDKLLYSWDDVEQQGPVLIAWTIFRHLCLPQENQQLTSFFGDSAMKCHLIEYLHSILNYTVFQKKDDPLAGLVKTLVYVLMSLILKIFQEDTLGSYQLISSIISSILNEPNLSATFLVQDQNGGIATFIKSSQNLFPYMMQPYLHMLTSLCTNEDAVSLVYEMIERQTSFTELFGKNQVADVQMVNENIWKRTAPRLIVRYFKEQLVLPANTEGKIFNHNKDDRLVRWEYSYSGWVYLLLELYTISDDVMSYTNNSGEDGPTIATFIINLITCMLKQDIRRIDEFEQFIVIVFTLIKRCCTFNSIPIELIASCLKCIQVVSKELPHEMWNQLMDCQFLPSHKSSLDPNQVKTLTPGYLGMILTNHEIPTKSYTITREYLQFLHGFIQSVFLADPDVENTSSVQKIYLDLAVNMVFLLKEIFANFGRWGYNDVNDKSQIGLKCLEIFHLILSSNSTDIQSDNKSLPSLQEHVMEGLSYQPAGEALLTIISIGVDGVENMTELHDSTSPDVIQLVKLSFAVLHAMFENKNKQSNDIVTPLQLSLSQQYIQQPSELDFMQATCKETFIAVIAKYIYHRVDPKLPILAILVLRSLAKLFPMVLTASFGSSLVGLCNAFVNKLNSMVQPVRLKIIIIEFLMTCIETQPGIIESFSQLTQNKSTGEYTIGRFSCLTPIFGILEDKENFDILSVTALEFMADLWLNRYDLAMTVLKKSKPGFWTVVCHPLKELNKKKESKLVIDVSRHILDMISVEVYYITDTQLADDLITVMKAFEDGKIYEKIAKLLLPNADADINQILLLKTWKKFLSVMKKLQAGNCGLDDDKVVGDILNGVLDLLSKWLYEESSQLRCDMLVELSNLLYLISHKWKRTLSSSKSSKLIQTLNNLLMELSMSDEQLMEEVLTPLYSSALIQLIESNHDGVTDGLLPLCKIVCTRLQYHLIVLEKDNEKNQCLQKGSLLSINLLNEISSKLLSDSSQENFLMVLKEHGTIHNLLNTMNFCLQKTVNLDFIEATLTLLLKISEKKALAEHLSICGIGKFLCLSLDISNEWKSQDSVLRIWSIGLGIASHLLKTLKYSFVQQAIDFIGAHKEIIVRGMNVIDQLANGSNLLLSEKISVFLYEVATYQSDVTFALPEVYQIMKDHLGQMLRMSTALLGRQKLLSHLVECKAGENIEHLISRTKTPSPTSFRSDSVKSLTSEVLERSSPNVEQAQCRLVNILCFSVATMRKLTPNVAQSILDEGMDIDSFVPLVDLNFSSPTLDIDIAPSFGTLVSALNMSLKILKKMSQSESDRTTPEKDFSYTLTPDDDRKRSQLWFLIDNVLIVLISQASCYLRHPKVDEREKQFLKRELGTELSNFIYAVHRLRNRRGVPASPISSDKSAVPAYRRSPSKLSISFTEEEENSIFRIADMYTKTLLR